MDDTWTLAQGEIDGTPAFVRRNKAAGTLAGSAGYDVRVGIAVPFNTPNEYGLPTQDEMDRVAEFEDGMAAIVGERAVFVLVITSGGVREFILYTGDADWLPKLHMDLRGILPNYDIEMAATLDPNWELYRAFGTESAPDA